MANQKHVDLLRQGVEVWNQWRKQHPEIQPDLSSANLPETILSRADLRRTDLSGAANLHRANLSGANLYRADLGWAILSKADLSGAFLQGADLSGANLSEANLSEAELGRANLSGANLSAAKLDFAITSGTIFAQVDLRTTKGLVRIHHRGPSCVELHTVQIPQDDSALHFLRGAGVPDAWIDLYRAQIMSPIQYHSCFISYSSKDEVLAQRLHADLQDQGVRCWFAPEDLKWGDKIRPRIDESIHLHDKLLLVLSEHSVASQWVEQEVETALEKERKEGRTVLFPIRLDKAVMEVEGGWPALIRNTRNIGDFTHWKRHDSYQKALERLLRDLKAETSKPEA